MANSSSALHRALSFSLGIDQSNATPRDAQVLLQEHRGGPVWLLRAARELAEQLASKTLSIPTRPNERLVTDKYLALWRRPDEWMILFHNQSTLGADPAESIGENANAIWIDVSSAYTILSISGEKARWVLAKGMTIDLHPNVFSTNHCAQTLLAQVPVLIWRESSDDYRLMIQRSLTDYIWRWLIDAAGEHPMALLPLADPNSVKN